jgi:hypothetical protein
MVASMVCLEISISEGGLMATSPTICKGVEGFKFMEGFNSGVGVTMGWEAVYAVFYDIEITK